jgi:glycosyltransferase involved in cell wall biosynthesis
MRTLSVVIPALNEAGNIPHVIAAVPVAALRDAGWETEIVVVDNASTDGTGEVAERLGARVVRQPDRGYGNAYRAGLDSVRSEVVATGDADRTYPFDALPDLLRQLDERRADFLSTNRLHAANRRAMKPSHFVANHVLSAISRLLFRHRMRDSQSGMWVFYSRVWQGIDVSAPGMAFSQEIKNAAVRGGYRVEEVPIEYRARAGEVKLKALSDGWSNLRSLFTHRFGLGAPAAAPAAVPAVPARPAGPAQDGVMADCAPQTVK